MAARRGSRTKKKRPAPARKAPRARHAPVVSAGAPAPIGPYSQAVRTGGYLFCSGQIGLDPASGALVVGGVEAECVRVLDNIAAVLGQVRLGFSDIVKTTIFLRSMADFPKVNDLYAARFPAGAVFPARSTIAVADLPKNAQVEIEVVAQGV